MVSCSDGLLSFLQQIDILNTIIVLLILACQFTNIGTNLISGGSCSGGNFACQQMGQNGGTVGDVTNSCKGGFNGKFDYLSTIICQFVNDIM